MNYAFQTRGILVNGQRRFDYQRFDLLSLAETGLIEVDGLGGSSDLAGYETFARSTAGVYRRFSADGPIDWNGNARIGNRPITFDINGNSLLRVLLATPDQWESLIFDGGAIGSTDVLGVMQRALDDSRELLPIVELTEEMDQQIR